MSRLNALEQAICNLKNKHNLELRGDFIYYDLQVPLSSKMRTRILGVLNTQLREEKLRQEGAEQVKEQIDRLF